MGTNCENSVVLMQVSQNMVYLILEVKIRRGGGGMRGKGHRPCSSEEYLQTRFLRPPGGLMLHLLMAPQIDRLPLNNNLL